MRHITYLHGCNRLYMYFYKLWYMFHCNKTYMYLHIVHNMNFLHIP